jgi:hypothetical protein
LSALRWIIVQQRNTSALARGTYRGSNARRPSADHHHIKLAILSSCHGVRTSIPGLHTIWQLRSWGRPSMATRHSKQMPIPQSGARASPVTE